MMIPRIDVIKEIYVRDILYIILDDGDDEAKRENLREKLEEQLTMEPKNII